MQSRFRGAQIRLRVRGAQGRFGMQLCLTCTALAVLTLSESQLRAAVFKFERDVTVRPPGGRELGPLRPQRERRAGHFNGQWRLDPPAPGRVSVPPSARLGARVAPLLSCPPTAA